MAAASPHTHPAPAADRRSEGRAGSRRIFPPQFKLQVLEAYRRDAQCRGNQRATARKFGIHRRQIQKWLQAEPALRAALLRRAPQAAPSPPPYSVGSPESARLPSPPPPPLVTMQPATLPTPVQVCPVLPQSLQVIQPPVSLEPIDLSVRRVSPLPELSPIHVPSHAATAPSSKPVKLFRPYLLEEKSEHRQPLPTMPVTHVSAFVPVQSAVMPVVSGCSLAACPAPRWCAPVLAYPAPLR